MVIEVRLKEILKERGITQKAFSEQSGIREGYLSELINNRRSTVNREHLAKLIETLGITDMNQVFVLK